MNFEYGDKAKEVRDAVAAFMAAHVYPNEEEMLAQVDEGDRWQPIPLLEELKAKARAEGLWNLFLPESDYGAGSPTSTTRPPARKWGAPTSRPRSSTARRPIPATWRCWSATAPRRSANSGWSRCWRAEIRSAFGMTEIEVASSDATNIETRIERDGDSYVVNGRKWWTSGALDPRCRILIVMGKTDPENPTATSSSR